MAIAIILSNVPTIKVALITHTQRPSGLHSQTWRRINRASDCTGNPLFPITETLSNRYRNEHGAISDGHFINECGNLEPYSSTFTFSLKVPSVYSGETLFNVGLCALHQGIVLFAPLLDRAYPFAYGLGFDTNLPLSFEASVTVLDFLTKEDSEQEQHYSRAWARAIERLSWLDLSFRLRQNVFDISHVSCE